MSHIRKYLTLCLSFILLNFFTAVHAETVSVAVAANFAEPLKQIAKQFEAKTGHSLQMSVSSTGKLYAQVKNGAPFDVFLSADAKTPKKIEQEKLGVQSTRFTYAIGQLALWSADPNLVDSKGAVLKSNKFKHLAIANPKLAPYGEAAMQTLSYLKLDKTLAPLFVTGENIGQTYQFVATKNAELGFVALSQIYKNGRVTKGSAWIVNPKYYKPIKQDAILLAHGQNNVAAKAFLSFLKTEASYKVLRDFGYSY